jgi:hypothetical protein
MYFPFWKVASWLSRITFDSAFMQNLRALIKKDLRPTNHTSVETCLKDWDSSIDMEW